MYQWVRGCFRLICGLWPILSGSPTRGSLSEGIPVPENLESSHQICISERPEDGLVSKEAETALSVSITQGWHTPPRNLPHPPLQAGYPATCQTSTSSSKRDSCTPADLTTWKLMRSNKQEITSTVSTLSTRVAGLTDQYVNEWASSYRHTVQRW